MRWPQAWPAIPEIFSWHCSRHDPCSAFQEVTTGGGVGCSGVALGCPLVSVDQTLTDRGAPTAHLILFGDFNCSKLSQYIMLITDHCSLLSFKSTKRRHWNLLIVIHKTEYFLLFGYLNVFNFPQIWLLTLNIWTAGRQRTEFFVFLL